MNVTKKKKHQVSAVEAALSKQKDRQSTSKRLVNPERPDSPTCVSLKSDSSKRKSIEFTNGGKINEPRSPVTQKRPDSSVPTCVSLKSDSSRIEPIEFTNGGKINEPRSPVTQERLEPAEPSSVSISSGRSKGEPIQFSKDQHYNKKRSDQQQQTKLDSVFMRLEENMVAFVRKELRKLQKVLGSECAEDSELREDEEVMGGGEEEQRKSNRESFLKFTLNFIRSMKEEELADCLQSKTHAAICQRKLKSNLKKKFQCLFEGIAKAGNPTLLNQIYTELHITEGECTDVNDQHEVRKIEAASWKPTCSETTITCEDIFKPLPGRTQPVRTMVTKGVAGIGKTVLTQKFMLDWAEDKDNQDIQFIFPFTFRELNLLKTQNFSLVELLHNVFTETKEAGICRFEEFQVVFIFDGLDECRLPLDFKNNVILTDITETSSVDVLLTNLIRGNLVPSACLWITTRPAAANQIPPECVDMVTEVRGFTDPQKDEYFRKRFRDEKQSDSIISHIKTSRSLHIMCHIPVFCWITATVLEDVLKTREEGELPKTLTEMYIYFLVVQTKMKNIKYDRGVETDPHWSPDNMKMIESLGKLAFVQLEKGNLIFYEEDLKECDIDLKSASVHSGVLTQIFREERGLNEDKVFCFVHLSVHEFMAALYVLLTFINTGVDLLKKRRLPLRHKSKVKHFYQTAVDKALQSPNGHLDLFVRFLLGLSLETNQIFLTRLLKKTGSKPEVKEKLVQYIKKKLRDCDSPERSINLFHCLNELNDHSLVEEIQQYLRSGSVQENKLSSSQCSALVFILLSSQKDLDVFDLKKFSASEEGLLLLLPVVKALKTSLLSGCNLSGRSCEALAKVLTSTNSNLRELDLSDNDLNDTGVKRLSEGLRSLHCQLQVLRLSGCNFSGRSCEALAKVLTSTNSNLRELDLSDNDLNDTGVKRLSEGLRSPHCQLQVLRLSGCLVTEEGCASLVSALSSNPSHLKELDLSFNHPGDSGIKQLFAGLRDSHWKLETLKLENCGKCRLKPSPLRYFCKLSLDPNTANRNLSLFEDSRGVKVVREEQPYPDHPERFDSCKQLLCSEGLTGRCYWEVQWKGRVYIGVTYRGIRRSGDSDDCCIGWNDQSWSLICTDQSYTAWHNNTPTDMDTPKPSDSHRVGVYLDWAAGTVSFYSLPSIVSSIKRIHIHTFHSTFTEPLYPAFGFGRMLEFGSKLPLSVYLPQVEE